MEEIIRDPLAGFGCPDESTLRQQVPLLLQFETEDTQKRLWKRLYSLCSIEFDGTPHIGELFGIVVRYLTEDWQLCQEVLTIQRTDVSVDAESLSELLLRGVAMLDRSTITCIESDSERQQEGRLCLSAQHVNGALWQCACSLPCGDRLCVADASNVRWYAWIANYKAVIRHFQRIDDLLPNGKIRRS